MRLTLAGSAGDSPRPRPEGTPANSPGCLQPGVVLTAPYQTNNQKKTFVVALCVSHNPTTAPLSTVKRNKDRCKSSVVGLCEMHNATTEPVVGLCVSHSATTDHLKAILSRLMGDNGSVVGLCETHNATTEPSKGLNPSSEDLQSQMKASNGFKVGIGLVLAGRRYVRLRLLLNTPKPLSDPLIYQDVETHGFCLHSAVVSEEKTRVLREAIAELALNDNTRSRGAGVFGIRNLLSAVPVVRQLAASDEMRALVEPCLGPSAFAVRGIFFDKTREANWQLRWHQDRAIPVCQRHDVPGFGPWSTKAGVPHVYPPVEILESMLTVRLHLDPCDASHGALRVLPGSHLMGFLEEEELRRLVAREGDVACDAKTGDALVMRPLLAHASARCQRPGHRRVVHLEYAAASLPEPLEWYERVPTDCLS